MVFGLYNCCSSSWDLEWLEVKYICSPRNRPLHRFSSPCESSTVIIYIFSLYLYDSAFYDPFIVLNLAWWHNDWGSFQSENRKQRKESQTSETLGCNFRKMKSDLCGVKERKSAEPGDEGWKVWLGRESDDSLEERREAAVSHLHNNHRCEWLTWFCWISCSNPNLRGLFMIYHHLVGFVFSDSGAMPPFSCPHFHTNELCAAWSYKSLILKFSFLQSSLVVSNFYLSHVAHHRSHNHSPVFTEMIKFGLTAAAAVVLWTWASEDQNLQTLVWELHIYLIDHLYASWDVSAEC